MHKYKEEVRDLTFNKQQSMRTLSISSCINSFRTYAVLTGVCKPVAQWLQDVCMIDNHYHINTINQKLETPHIMIRTRSFQRTAYTPMLIYY